MNSGSGSIITIFVISLLVLLTTCTARTCSSIKFDQNCGGHLKRAADANTIDMAKKELAIALNYMEQNNLRSGYTSVVYQTPDEDIGFWYNNVLASHDELDKVTEETTQLERSNLLIKLRETLLDKGEKSESITCPDGISVYPHNTIYAILTLLSCIGVIFGVAYGMASLEN